MVEKKLIQVQTRFTKTEKERLEKQASKEGRSVSNLIHTVILDYLKDK